VQAAIDDPQGARRAGAEHPWKRAVQPEAIARLVVFLASGMPTTSPARHTSWAACGLMRNVGPGA